MARIPFAKRDTVKDAEHILDQLKGNRDEAVKYAQTNYYACSSRHTRSAKYWREVLHHLEQWRTAAYQDQWEMKRKEDERKRRRRDLALKLIEQKALDDTDLLDVVAGFTINDDFYLTEVLDTVVRWCDDRAKALIDSDPGKAHRWAADAHALVQLQPQLNH